MYRPSMFLLAASLVLAGPAFAADSPRTILGQINNGLLTSGHPSVGMFFTGQGTCTATLIGCQTALTAAHCVCEDGPCSPSATGKLVFFQHSGGYQVSSIWVHPGWTQDEGIGLGRHDLAVLRFAAPVAGVQPSFLATSKPAIGTSATLVGFGITPTTPDGLKRVGQVQLIPCADGNPGGLCYNFEAPLGAPGADSTACPGDSGGPMFVNLGSSLFLSGVTSGGFGPGSEDCTAPVQGIYTDVFSDLAWIQAQSGSDLAQSSCGGLPNAGSSLAPFSSGAGLLDASHSSASFTVEVPTSTQFLHTFLNTEEYVANDFDLYVKSGSPASETNFDCKSESESSIEECVIENPVPGTWHLSVARFVGAGVFQLTATTYKATSTSGPCLRDADTACLQNDRFEVNITWQNPQGSGTASVMSFGGQRAESVETAFYSFQSATNFEMGVKILNACVPFLGNKFWVFLSGLTDQGWVVTVRDTQTDAVRTYSNPVGKLSTTFADTAAFSCP
jgi:hypothetical protein